MTEKIHIPVLLSEVIENMPKNPKVFVDGTLGFGGHSRVMLERFPKLTLIGIDQDDHALEQSKEYLKEFEKRISLNKENFSNFDEILDKEGIEKVDAILVDLGVSSYQLDQDTRGFSFSKEGPLDMRMDTEGDLTAYDIVNGYREKDLADVIYEYGNERFSRRIAKLIVERRKKKRIETTTELRDIVVYSLPAPYKKNLKIDPATKTFQAIRIEVNNELGVLKEFLEKASSRLNKEGRLQVISFHSLEDRIVKNFFRENKDKFEIITKKPIVATEEEVRVNPRSRSAKLRIAEFKGDSSK